MHKLLSIALIIGGLLVGGVILWLMRLYVAEGLLSGVTAVILSLIGLLLFALPQFILAAYLLYTRKQKPGF
jgi:multisubunit Na+/H+ antiporter MnhE subunit